MSATLHDVGEVIGRVSDRFDAIVCRRADEAPAPRKARTPRAKLERMSASAERALNLVPDLIVWMAKDLRFLVREYRNLDLSTKSGRAAAKKVERFFDKVDGLADVRLDAVGVSVTSGSKDRLSAEAEQIIDRLPADIRKLASLFRTLAKEYQSQSPITEFGKAVRDRIKKQFERLGYLPGNYSGVY